MPPNLRRFFFLIFLLSIPFWAIGFLPIDPFKEALGINLPISALMAFCPAVAASILCYQRAGMRGVGELFARVLDFRKIQLHWYVPILLLLPVIYVLSYVIMRAVGMEVPEPQTPLVMVPVFFAMYFVGGIGEELGWSGYATDTMQNRWGALKASIMLGAITAVWHVIPFFQGQNPVWWIIWQCIYSVAGRVLTVWIYNNTGKSLFAAILFHIMSNICWSMFPNYGSHYNPFVVGLLTSLAAGIVIAVWRPDLTGRNRLAKASQSD